MAISPSTSSGVVLFATADWANAYWTNKQHTAKHLSESGYPVLYVESIGLRTPGLNKKDLGRIVGRLKRLVRPIKKVAPDIWVFTPFTIPLWQYTWVMKFINSWLLKLPLWFFCRLMGFKRPIVWTYHPMMLQTLGLLKPSKLVYHCVDDLSAVHGIDPQQIRHLEEQLIRKSDAVFTTSTNLQSMVEEICQGKGHYYPNVADIEHFEQARAPQVDEPKDLQGILHPRIVYVGVLTDYKIDFQLLKGLAEARPNWQWILIGEEREGQNDPTLAQLSQRGNVHLLGHRAYKDLPQFLASCDVAILPTHINQYTQSMFPMKFFEYLAAGLPVVSTNLPSLAPYQAFFKSSQNPQEFLNNLEEVLNSDPAPIPTQELSPFSWKTRLKHQLKALEPQQ